MTRKKRVNRRGGLKLKTKIGREVFGILTNKKKQRTTENMIFTSKNNVRPYTCGTT